MFARDGMLIVAFLAIASARDFVRRMETMDKVDTMEKLPTKPSGVDPVDPLAILKARLQEKATKLAELAGEKPVKIDGIPGANLKTTPSPLYVYVTTPPFQKPREGYVLAFPNIQGGEQSQMTVGDLKFLTTFADVDKSGNYVLDFNSDVVLATAYTWADTKTRLQVTLLCNTSKQEMGDEKTVEQVLQIGKPFDTTGSQMNARTLQTTLSGKWF